jgi:hypothetical protein
VRAKRLRIPALRHAVSIVECSKMRLPRPRSVIDVLFQLWNVISFE